jgi:hypothetical protein
VYRRPGGAREEPPISELYHYGRNSLRNNYLFWTVLEEPTNYFDRVVSFLNSSAVPADPAGGLSAQCPKRLGTCVTY